jgi:CTP:molybdopterin cytidylyltransferase MocA
VDSKQASKEEGSVWVVVLATESESNLTRSEDSSGDVRTPAQYRSTEDGLDSPLQRSLRHAGELAPRERICVVVAAEHREWWRRPLWFLPASNVVAQPENAPIAHGVSQSMQKILERDRAAKVVLLPAGDQARSPSAVVGRARTLQYLFKRHWPKALEDVQRFVSPVPC